MEQQKKGWIEPTKMKDKGLGSWEPAPKMLFPSSVVAHPDPARSPGLLHGVGFRGGPGTLMRWSHCLPLL